MAQGFGGEGMAASHLADGEHDSSFQAISDKDEACPRVKVKRASSFRQAMGWHFFVDLL
jgi:hypothetical protein